MIMFIIHVLCLLLSLKTCYSLGITNVSSIGAACVHVANNFTLYSFNCNSLDLDYSCRCRDPSFLGTVLICIDDNSDTADTVTNSYHYLMDVCQVQGKKKYLFTDLVSIFSNATKYAINYTDIENSSLLTHPVLPNRELFGISIKSVKSLIKHRTTSTAFGAALLSYWGIIIIVGMTNNMGVWCVPSVKMGLNGKVSKWLKRHLINPQLFSRNTNKKRKTTLGKLVSAVVRTFPTRLESIVIGIYAILAIIFCCVDYQFQYPNTIFKYRTCGTLVYIADRTGIIAISQLPLLFLFAGRNNFLVPITGWTYRTFNIYHRWIARVVWVLLLIHAVCYVAFSKKNNDYKSRWSLEKWRWANTALICSGIMIFFSFRSIRKLMYEVFKSSHQIMSMLFVIGSWNHCKTLGWMEFLYATVAIWAFDHAVRAGKIFVSGGVVFATCEAIMEDETAQYKEFEKELQVKNGNVDEKEKEESTIIALKSTTAVCPVHSIRVTISHSGWWRDYPGCYVFLYFLRPTVFWQSHPFTLIESSTIETVDQLNIIIRVKDGATRQLADFLSKQDNHIAQIPVLVEGPYGTPIAFRNYQNAIFVAAGVGITVVYTLAMDLARQYKAEILRGDYGVDEHAINVIWVTPKIKTLEVCLSEIESMAAASEINFQVYITKDSLESLKESGSFPELSKQKQETIMKIVSNEIPGVAVHIGQRPQVKKMVLNRVEHLVGNTAIVGCGPDSLNREVRAAAGKWMVQEQNSRVDYFEEELLW